MRDLRHADVGIGEHRRGSLEVVLGEFRGTPARATEATGGRETRLSALPDQTPLEFRERAKHVKDQPPLCGRRVEGFGQAAKPDASNPKIFDGFDQLLHRTGQTVELPDDQRVAAAREFEGVVQGRPIRDRTRHLFGENPLAPCFGERVPLQGEILVDGRNPRVADQHRFRRDVAGIG